MKRWWLLAALLLSLGVNVGLLVGRMLGSGAPPAATVSSPDSDLGPEAGGPEAGGPEAGGEAPGAAPGAPRIPRRLERMVDRMADDLSLSGEPRRRFLSLQHDFFRTTVEKRALVRRLQHALREELLSETPDRRRAEQHLAGVTRAQGEMEEAFVANYFDTRALLETPEQQRLLRRFMARLRHMREDIERRQEKRRFEERSSRRPGARDRRGGG